MAMFVCNHLCITINSDYVTAHCFSKEFIEKIAIAFKGNNPEDLKALN